MKTFQSILLFLVAIILSPLLLVGIIWSFVKLMIGMKIYQWWNRLGDYFFKSALAIDQLGNVMCMDMFNSLLIKDDSTPFGDEDETISSVLGKNQLKGNLTKLGMGLNWILNRLDPNHSIEAIEEKCD
jgi:hypothetical protein